MCAILNQFNTIILHNLAKLYTQYCTMLQYIFHSSYYYYYHHHHHHNHSITDIRCCNAMIASSQFNPPPLKSVDIERVGRFLKSTKVQDRKTRSHPHKVNCKVNYPTCWIPLIITHTRIHFRNMTRKSKIKTVIYIPISNTKHTAIHSITYHTYPYTQFTSLLIMRQIPYSIP